MIAPARFLLHYAPVSGEVSVAISHLGFDAPRRQKKPSIRFARCPLKSVVNIIGPSQAKLKERTQGIDGRAEQAKGTVEHYLLYHCPKHDLQVTNVIDTIK